MFSALFLKNVTHTNVDQVVVVKWQKDDNPLPPSHIQFQFDLLISVVIIVVVALSILMMAINHQLQINT